MAGARRGGGVSRRCECRGPDGKLLGNVCPKLKRRSHGAPYVRQELPLGEGGKRRAFRRTGYATVKDAQADLDKVRAILDLAGDDESDLRRVGDLLADVSARRADIPDPSEVQRRLGVGVPLEGKMTVGQWLEVWRASKKTRGTTNKGYDSHIRVHLVPHLGHIRLDKLSVGHVQEMFDAIADAADTIEAENKARREQEARCRRSRPGAPKAAERRQLAEQIAKEKETLASMPPYRRVTGAASRQRIRSTLRAALNAAIARQLITFNPAAHVELESGKRPRGLLWTEERVARWRETGHKPSPVMVWTPEQLGAFLDAAEQHPVHERIYALFHLITHHGYRRGEAVGLDWADIDMQRGFIATSTEIVVDGWTPVETPLKTDESSAPVRIDRGTVEVLQAHRMRQLAERDERNRWAAREREAGRRADDWEDTGKVFTTLDGSWLHPEYVSDAFRQIVAAAGLPPINLRDARHGAAALVKAGGGDLHDAKTKLRHSTITLTSDTYMELFQDYEADLAERAAAVVPRARRKRERA